MDNISAEKRISNKDLLPGKGFDQIEGLVNDDFEGLNILETAGSLNEGMIYGLSLPQLAESLGAKVLIVNLWEDCKSVDALLDAKKTTWRAFSWSSIKCCFASRSRKS